MFSCVVLECRTVHFMSARDPSDTLGWTPLGGVGGLPHGSTVVSDPVPTRQWSVSSPVLAAQSFQQSQVGRLLCESVLVHVTLEFVPLLMVLLPSYAWGGRVSR